MNLHPAEAFHPVPASAAIGKSGWIRYRRGYGSGSVIWKKYPLDLPCISIRTTPQGWKPNIDRAERKLSAVEIAAIHSYPIGYQFTGSHSGIWKLIGNSVPPLFMKAIAFHVKQRLLEVPK